MITSKSLVASLLLAAAGVGACATAEPALHNRAASSDAAAAPHEASPAVAAPAKDRVIERAPPVDLGPAKAAAGVAVDQAVTAAGERVAGWWKPLPKQPDYTALLDPSRKLDVPLSLGTVGSGKLENAVQIPPEGQFYSVIERHRHRHTQYGSQALIDLIEQAAEQVGKAAPGAKLRLGNMSRRRGGDIPWSSSHNSGRDADLAFYCKRKEDGASVPAPDLLEFDSTGEAIKRPDLVFDVARNWELVKALLTNQEVGIQWIFVSKGLKHLLLEYAKNHGASQELLAHAQKVLHQPTDAPPHNDHFHLRITCPRRDRLEGCLDFGPRWKWVDWHYDDLLARSMALARAFHAPKVETRIRALDFLERIRSPYAPELALAAALHEKSDEVRQRALEVAASVPNWSGAAVAAAVRFVENPAFSVDQKSYAYSVLRRSVDPLAVAPLKKRVADTRLGVDERAMAAHALVHFMEPELVPFLLDQLAKQPPEVAARLATALRRVTNRAEAIDWQSDGDDARGAALQNWHKWWKTHQKATREAWLEEGFAAHGWSEDTLVDLSSVDDLIGLLHSGPDYIAYNANLTLKRITGRWAPLEAWNNARLYRYWSRWWRSAKSDMIALR